MMRQASEAMRDVATRYADYFGHLSPDRVGEVMPLLSDDIHFIDPFNDVRGRDNYRAVIAKMFEDVKDPRFEILDLAWSGEICLMRWDFSCSVAYIGDWTVRGITELQFDSDGRISAHYDYWDSGRHFFGRLPVIGAVIRWIRKKAQV
ncbi:SnoaL-like domain-containing protein [Cohaesibacter sp. ES.047]|uniref:nuclear transport factor 2 family protein n=1 Tax=Cohaesibacter sp. ES.047 TaxID=1798205 RepID=UPI000BBF850E|nr:nuclear transport factor 2 family protein [Cohaesibacter sp. ES.047]SNY94243.1 SnoaL-like domain-containing protein [Cohaesibacter sp. ES.047]